MTVFSRSYPKVNNIFEAHYFFVRQSQHYLNGNWHEYKPFTLDQYLYYPVAYVKFMSMIVKDLLDRYKTTADKSKKRLETL